MRTAFTQNHHYNPVNDPLRISNLDLDIVEPLRRYIKDEEVKITHIVMIEIESVREELFPLQQGSPWHQIILDSHPEADHDMVNERLSKLTPNAEKVTGNSKSSKYFLGSHCGVWPLAVDGLEEAECQVYQPCLPHILNMFNAKKAEKSSLDQRDMPNWAWDHMFCQAVTDSYVRQDDTNEKIGFTKIVARSKLDQEAESVPGMKPLHYFGYAEPYTKHYMEEFIDRSIATNTRMFLSHFTSSTHHPWKMPPTWKSKEYMGRKDAGVNHKDFDSYLDAVGFHDWWLVEMMQMLEDKGIADETLVVFVSDHGQSFLEDTSTLGTFDNGHISNFRVPISLYHPRLPRHPADDSGPAGEHGSLDGGDARAARDLAHDYEGQSLIRPYKAFEEEEDGKDGGRLRRAWNFGVANLGGRVLTVTSADAPWRLTMPVDEEESIVEYLLTDLSSDPLELDPVKGWEIAHVVAAAEKRFGHEAASWADEAEKVARWWAEERKKLWNYKISRFIRVE